MTKPSEALELLQRVYEDEKGLRFGSVEFSCTLAAGQAGYPDFAGIGLDLDFGLELDDEGLRVKDVLPSMCVLDAESAPPAELVSTYPCGAPSALIDRSSAVIHRGDILRAVGEYPVTNANDHHKSVIKKVMLSKFKNQTMNASAHAAMNASSSHPLNEESTSAADRQAVGVRCIFLRVLSCQDALEYFDLLKGLRNVWLCEQTMDTLRHRVEVNSALSNALLSMISTDCDDLQRTGNASPRKYYVESMMRKGPEEPQGDENESVFTFSDWSPPYLFSQAASVLRSIKKVADTENEGEDSDEADCENSEPRCDRDDPMELYADAIVAKAESITFARIAAGVSYECIPHLMSSAMSEARVMRTPKKRTLGMKMAAVVGALSEVGSRVMSRYSSGVQYLVVSIFGLLLMSIIVGMLTLVSSVVFDIPSRRGIFATGGDMGRDLAEPATSSRYAPLDFVKGSDATARWLRSYDAVGAFRSGFFGTESTDNSNDNKGGSTGGSKRLSGVHTPDVFFPEDLQKDMRRFANAGGRKSKWEWQ